MFYEIKNKRYYSFALDWVILIIVLILVGITAIIPPFERQFKLDDITISHPHKGDTVKMVPMVVSGILNTFLIQ